MATQLQLQMQIPNSQKNNLIHHPSINANLLQTTCGLVRLVIVINLMLSPGSTGPADYTP